ncbi:MAG: MBL fold metallo-hydrolase [Pseudomonadota bacterium]
MTTLNRRNLLIGGTALPTALAMGRSALAAGHEEDLQGGRARSFRIGDMDVTTLLSGTAQNDDPQKIFAAEVPVDEFEAVSTENFLSVDSLQFYYTPTLVRAGDATILFDTGLSAESLAGPLGEAGVGADEITHVVITHMHPDHIGGMTHEDGTLAYPNAAYLTGAVEFDAAASGENQIFDVKVRPFADRFEFLDDGAALAPGVTAMAAFGHTPGHMTYRLESGGQQVLLVADLVGHYVWSFAYPEWTMLYDADKDQANATRRRVLDLLATDKIPMIGYHMPFPAAGFVETRGTGFRFVPVSYQMMG